MSLQQNNLYMAMELSKKNWRLSFSDGTKQRQKTIVAGDAYNLKEQISIAKKRFGLPEDSKVISCYEAGRDGFWIHRLLTHIGVQNIIIDPSSIEVSRRARICKTDRLDACRLLDLLLRDKCYGLGRPYSVVAVPSIEDEDRMRINRDRQRLLKERGAHLARLRSLYATQAAGDVNFRKLKDASELRKWNGEKLGANLRAEMQRELCRLWVVEEQIKELEELQKKLLIEAKNFADQKAAKLLLLKGVGPQTALLLSHELLAWRYFANRKKLWSFLGMTGTPYSSGDSIREQGISKSGSARLRTAMIELAWMWVRYQPDNELTKWFDNRIIAGGARAKRKSIVALARKLVVALWKYVEFDEDPVGAKFKKGSCSNVY